MSGSLLMLFVICYLMLNAYEKILTIMSSFSCPINCNGLPIYLASLLTSILIGGEYLGFLRQQFFLCTFLCIFVQGRQQPTQSQLIQIYSVDWTDVYDTYNIEHRTEPVSH